MVYDIIEEDTGYRIQDTAGYRIQDTGYRIQDTMHFGPSILYIFTLYFIILYFQLFRFQHRFSISSFLLPSASFHLLPSSCFLPPASFHGFILVLPWLAIFISSYFYELWVIRITDNIVRTTTTTITIIKYNLLSTIIYYLLSSTTISTMELLVLLLAILFYCVHLKENDSSTTYHISHITYVCTYYIVRGTTVLY